MTPTEPVRDVIVSDDRQGPTKLLSRRIWTVVLDDGSLAELRLRVARGRLVATDAPEDVD